MTEKADVSSLLSNVCRTMPHTIKIGAISYALVFRSPDASFFAVGLAINSIANHLTKLFCKVLLGRFSNVILRPERAVDVGIYPQHYPRKSSTSGMPSGHAQTSAFSAVLLSRAVWDGTLWAALSLFYIWSVAFVVMASRTRFGSIFAVTVDGHRVAQHTFLQVVVGSLLGGTIGHAATQWWYDGTRRCVYILVALVAIFTVCVVGVWESRTAGDDRTDKLDETELERTQIGFRDAESLFVSRLPCCQRV